MTVAPSLRLPVLAFALAACAICLATLAPTASAAPDPMSDADGDGLPYEWETPQATAPGGTNTGTGASTGTTGTGPTSPSRCGTKQRRDGKGRCVPKCKKGQQLKRGKCVKKKKKRRAKARGSRVSTRVMGAPTNVAALGADPNHKDIFVQIDYGSQAIRQNLACSELDAIVGAFASAPVPNPDGRTGINLHIDAGVTCPSRSYDLGGSRIFNAGLCPNTGATFQAAELPESRAGTFHIAGFSPTCGGGGGEGGAATLHGVKMAVFTDGPTFMHVLMHELGHNLGLDHGANFVPNRISSMNTRLYISDSGNGATEVVDYQRFGLPPLDENNLSEVAGISAPPEAHRFYVLRHCEGGTFPSSWPGDGSIDWNCNTVNPFGPPTIDPGTVAVDVNGDGQKTILPATGNEWLVLDYASGGKIGP